jgi:hypothetical protein
MVLPELREFKAGHTCWELIIGRNQFAPISGLLYPDGTVRRTSSLEAFMNGPAEGFTEKPDEEGMPIARQRAGRLAEYVRFLARNPATDTTWRERNTAVRALLVVNVYGADAAGVLKELEEARQAYRRGDHDSAYEVVEKLLRQAAKVLTDREKAKPAQTRPSE